MAVRILIAEDDEALGRIIDRGLRAHGFEIAYVDNGRDARKLAADSSVNLLLLDLASADGLVEEVRSNRPRLPILRLSSSPPTEDPHTLKKPFAFEELIARIRA